MESLKLEEPIFQSVAQDSVTSAKLGVTDFVDDSKSDKIKEEKNGFKIMSKVIFFVGSEHPHAVCKYDCSSGSTST